jgi:hypothetical protein
MTCQCGRGRVVRIDAQGHEIKRSACPTSHAEIIEALWEYYAVYACQRHVWRRFEAVSGCRRPSARDCDLRCARQRHELANPLTRCSTTVYPDQISVRHLNSRSVGPGARRRSSAEPHRNRPARRTGRSPETSFAHGCQRTRHRPRPWPPATATGSYAAAGRASGGSHDLLRIGRRSGTPDRQRYAGGRPRRRHAPRCAVAESRPRSPGIEAARVRPSLPFELIRGGRGRRTRTPERS